MLQRLSIRGKILAVVAVPILVLLLAVGVVTWNAAQSLSSTRNVEQLLGVIGAGRNFTDDLQTERNLSVNYVNSFNDGRNKRSDAQQSTDAAVAALDEAVAANPTPEGEAAVDQVNTALNRTQPDVYLVNLRDLNVTENGTGEWPTFPEADEVQAAADIYAGIAAEIDDIADSTPGSAGIAANLTSLSFSVALEGITTQRYLEEPAALQEQLIGALPNSDVSRAAFDSATDAIATEEVNEPTLLTVNDADEQLAQLPNVRNQVVNRSISVAVLNPYYADTIEPIVKLSSDIASVTTDRELAGQLRAFNSMDGLIERVRFEEVYTDYLLRAGFFLPGDSTYQRELVALSDIALANAQDTVDPLRIVDQVPPFGASSNPSVGDTSSFESIRTNIASGLENALIAERANDWPLQVSQEIDAQAPIRDSLWTEAQATSAATVQATVLQAILTVVGAVLVVIATIFIALVIARRIIGPLRRLTTTATAVRQELPRMVERVALPGETVDVSEVQIPVESSDEIGRLAEAFNGVNAATLAIAGEQAALRGSISEMFVNVARRDQVLLNRQLSSIDEMERTEDNPDTLTRLFALDHLATRMRRNSESLLVLAGIDTGRRLRRPMPLADVIRTASSEIELYERVQLELDADPAMVGHSALTAAHLFAELLENATVFSDPGTPVVVRTFERDGNFVVEVEDSGIGMTVDELREANNRVASTAASEILGAQRLGLFVVGRIARRVGARVTITSKEAEGTTAIVTMPPSLFDTRVQESHEHVSSTASDPMMHAPAALVSHNVADEVIDEPQEPDATKRPGSLAYQPAAMESGASLTGRTADAADDESGAAEPSVDDLIAADAADAPAATAVDTAALVGGLTASGLPARRRKASTDAGATSDEERSKIIGLPARATADQLSALDAEAPAGFTPAVSPEEIAPQTAEERASMFRGFRSRREAEQGLTSAIDPEAESMGQAARRGAFVEPLPVAEPAAESPMEIPAFVDDQPVTPAIPVLEEDEFSAPEVPSLEADELSAVEYPAAPAAESRPSFAMPKFEGAASEEAVPPATPAPEPEQWTVPTFVDEVAAPEAAVAPAVDDAPMVVPSLEDDAAPAPSYNWGQAPAEPVPAEQVPAEQVPSAPIASHNDSYHSAAPEVEAPPVPQEALPLSPSYGVEQVSLESGATFSEPTPAAPTSAPLSEGPEPAPYGQAPQLDPAELAALTATPSMDELLAGHDDDKPNFFSRLFGRGKKDAETASPASAPSAPAQAPFASAPPTTEAAQGAPSPGFAPAPFVAQPAPASQPVVEQPAPAPASFTPTADAHFPAPAPAAEDAPAAPATPAPFAPGRVSLYDQEPSPAEPSQWNAPQAQQPPQAPVAPVAYQAPAPASPPAGAANFFAPRAEAPAAQTQFSPDELASPTGWEAAGASALQASAPEVQTSYSPKVDLDSDHSGAPDLSSVFSEFSSLSAERPKVEKTRAGLQKRRASDAAPVEVTPIEEEVVVAPRERNADDVRSRFSSFYSGTARARSDAAEFERSQATTETKE